MSTRSRLRICTSCGDRSYVMMSAKNAKTVKLCAKCQYKLAVEGSRRRQLALGHRITCTNCDQPFHRNPAYAEELQETCCSKQCYDELTKRTLWCAACGMKMIVKRSYAYQPEDTPKLGGKRWPARKFCSVKCSADYRWRGVRRELQDICHG